ncbi:MAG: type II toxin-antitoxin system RelE/ParE family toxin [Lachnospiraceae bacterium]|nr:type II toxin-antitoxin system RelE/ParE family toxin [Lachnospiraceae bacterium]
MARVVFTEPAEYDLLDIEYYIFVDLCNPQEAQRISDGILGVVDKLAELAALLF